MPETQFEKKKLKFVENIFVALAHSNFSCHAEKFANSFFFVAFFFLSISIIYEILLIPYILKSHTSYFEDFDQIEANNAIADVPKIDNTLIGNNATIFTLTNNMNNILFWNRATTLRTTLLQTFYSGFS